MERSIWYAAAGAGALLLLAARPAQAMIPRAGGGGGKLPAPGAKDRVRLYLPAVVRAAARHMEFQGRHDVLVGLLWSESRFDPAARSQTGADGIGQFTSIGRAEVRRLMGLPEWSRRYGDVPGMALRLSGLTEADTYVAEVGIEAAALLLASLLAEWRGHVEAALTDYNAGQVAARAVYNAGSHAAALAAFKALPAEDVADAPLARSQAKTYAPHVLAAATDYRAGALA